MSRILQIANLALKIFNNANRYIIYTFVFFSRQAYTPSMMYLGSKNTQHQYELELIDPTNLGSWSPIVLTRVLNSELASTQAMSLLVYRCKISQSRKCNLSFAKMLNINSSMLVLSVWGSRCLAIVSLAKLPSLRRF